MTNIDATSTAEDRKFVTAMARGLQILRAFRRSDLWLTNQELASRTGLPRSTVSRAAYTLVETQFLEMDLGGQAYRLGSAVVQLASQLADWESVRRMIRPYMQDLAMSTGAAVGAAHLDGTELAYIEYCRPNSAVILSLGVGSRMPVIGTAAGRSLMASIPEEELARLRSRLAPLEEDMVLNFDRQNLAAQSELADLGYCTSFGAWQSEINAIATSLYVPVAALTIVITVAGPSMTFSPSRLTEEVGPQFLRTITAMRQKASGLI